MAFKPKLLAWLFTGILLLLSAPARADQVTVRFDSFDEPEPSEVCVIVNYSSLRSGEASIEEEVNRRSTKCGPTPSRLVDAYRHHELSDGDVHGERPDTITPASPSAPVDPPKGLQRPRMFCQSSGSTSKNRVLLFVYNAVLTELNFANGVLTLQVNPDKGSNAPTRLELVGRQYRPQTALPVRLRDGSQVVNIPLIPLCVERKLLLPDIVCSANQGQSAGKPQASALWFGSGLTQDPLLKEGGPSSEGNVTLPPGREQTLKLDNSRSTTEISVASCGHTFAARWSGPVPPKRLELESDTFTFRWRPNCLSPENTCPSVVMPGANVSCTGQNSGRPDKGECAYQCSGSTRFPVQVQLSFPDENATRSRIWSESLDTPGQLLLGYIAESQRSISLRWNWPSAVEPNACEKEAGGNKLECLKKYDKEQPHGCLAKYEKESSPEKALFKRRSCVQEYNRSHREERVYGVAGDRIDYTELRTPEGTVHRVHYAANQLRIPELDCQDYISYRYVGTRAYHEQVTPVDHDGSVRLDDPNDMRADKFALGAALGGGARIIHGAGPVAVGPQAEVNVIAVLRHLRPKVESLDLEFRVAAIFSTQPYCSRVAGAPGGNACADDEWERLPYWRFPLTFGVNWQIPKSLETDSPPLTFGLHTGVAFTSFFLSKDAPKLRRPALWSSRFNFGYRATRSVSFESYVWALVGEQPVETVFDEAGVQRHGAIGGVSTTSFIPGALIRVDDVF